MLCESVVTSCEGCQLGSDYRLRKVPHGQIESTSPWDMLSIDVIDLFFGSKKGERYILSIIDCFSKYLILVPHLDYITPSVSKALYERVIGYLGCPQRILLDRWAEFTGRIWDELMN